MASIKEIAKAAKSKIKSSKGLEDHAVKMIEQELPLNCSVLLDAFLGLYKFENDFNDLNSEIEELTPNLYFRVNADPEKYIKNIKKFYDKEDPGLKTDGIILCDIYYQRKDDMKPILKKVAKETADGKLKVIASALTHVDWFSSVVIRATAHPPGKINVNDNANHVKSYKNINRKELIKLLSKTTFIIETNIFSSWASFIAKENGQDGTPIARKTVDKFKNYNAMMTSLTKQLVEEVGREGAEIKKFFSIWEGNNFSNIKIGYAERLMEHNSYGSFEISEDPTSSLINMLIDGSWKK